MGNYLLQCAREEIVEFSEVPLDGMLAFLKDSLYKNVEVSR